MCMHIMEESFRKLFGYHIKVLLNKVTKNSVVAMLVGLFITPLIQSSSVVSLLILAFVEAGTILLQQAVGIIFGMNVGITIIPLLISLAGFG
ncbi:MAG: Na/Pi symporter [Candidatus Peribacteria bacterium]|nr:MAG: Na/Pi symporter [Candidatus Peribacteria bacterium]